MSKKFEFFVASFFLFTFFLSFNNHTILFFYFRYRCLYIHALNRTNTYAAYSPNTGCICAYIFHQLYQLFFSLLYLYICVCVCVFLSLSLFYFCSCSCSKLKITSWQQMEKCKTASFCVTANKESLFYRLNVARLVIYVLRFLFF